MASGPHLLNNCIFFCWCEASVVGETDCCCNFSSVFKKQSLFADNLDLTGLRAMIMS